MGKWNNERELNVEGCHVRWGLKWGGIHMELGVHKCEGNGIMEIGRNILVGRSKEGSVGRNSNRSVGRRLGNCGIR
jgi:hypothetical protein